MPHSLHSSLFTMKSEIKKESCRFIAGFYHRKILILIWLKIVIKANIDIYPLKSYIAQNIHNSSPISKNQKIQNLKYFSQCQITINKKKKKISNIICINIFFLEVGFVQICFKNIFSLNEKKSYENHLEGTWIALPPPCTAQCTRPWMPNIAKV